MNKHPFHQSLKNLSFRDSIIINLVRKNLPPSLTHIPYFFDCYDGVVVFFYFKFLDSILYILINVASNVIVFEFLR